jgi:hypothetical protein
MRPEDLAREFGISGKTLRGWLRREYPRPPGEHGAMWELDSAQVEAARARWRHGGASRPATPVEAYPRRPAAGARATSDEHYVIDLCDEILGERALRQHHFVWLLGEPARDGGARQLPVDGYYEVRRLVVEYRERQHDEAVPFFDRRQTVSGVGRGEQRRLYDERREREIPKHGLRLLVVRPQDLDADARLRLRRSRERDREALRALLAPFQSAPAQ